MILMALGAPLILNELVVLPGGTVSSSESLCRNWWLVSSVRFALLALTQLPIVPSKSVLA